MKANLGDLQMQAIQRRPDLREAQQSITAANSQYLLAKADAKKDINNLGVRDVQQVMLEVKVSEMARSVSTELGFHPFFSAGKNPADQ